MQAQLEAHGQTGTELEQLRAQVVALTEDRDKQVEAVTKGKQFATTSAKRVRELGAKVTELETRVKESDARYKELESRTAEQLTETTTKLAEAETKATETQKVRCTERLL